MSMLYGLAVDSGVKVEFGKTVLDVDAASPSVTLLDGSVINGDVIVGVYGESSLVRPLLETESVEEEGGDKDYFANIMCVPRLSLSSTYTFCLCGQQVLCESVQH